MITNTRDRLTTTRKKKIASESTLIMSGSIYQSCEGKRPVCHSSKMKKIMVNGDGLERVYMSCKNGLHSYRDIYHLKEQKNPLTNLHFF